jgi:hypothetical protein
VAGNREDCDVMIDQRGATDNRHFVRKLKLIAAPVLRKGEEKFRRPGEP